MSTKPIACGEEYRNEDPPNIFRRYIIIHFIHYTTLEKKAVCTMHNMYSDLVDVRVQGV